MKKLITITCMLYLYCGLTLTAQDTAANVDSRGNVLFGIKAGFNYSNVWDENGQDFRADARMGFAGGIFLGIPVGKFLGIQPEVLLSQKGFKGSGTLLGTSYSFSRRTTYIDFPIQLAIKPIPALTILAGPQYSYLMSQNDKYTFGPNSTEQEQEFENDNIRKNVLGFVAGADIIVSHVVVSGRIGWDFQTNNGDGTSYTPRYKNQWMQLTLGFKI